MQTEIIASCPMCNGSGEMLYEAVVDRLFSTPGSWSVFRCRDRTCAMLWLSPRPIQEDIGQAYAAYYTHDPAARTQGLVRKIYDKIVRHYVASRFLTSRSCALPSAANALGMLLYLFPGKRAVIDYLAGQLPVIPKGRMLEIGCGSGDALAFMHALGWSVTGVEMDAAAADVARKRGLDVAVGKLSEQDFRPASFEAITMNHVIEHLHDPEKLLKECHELLVPGGQIVLVTPNSRSLWHRLFQRNWMHLDPPRHLMIYSTSTLVKLLQTAGFNVVSTHTSIRDADGVFLGSMKIRKSGTYEMTARPAPGFRLVALVMQLVEAMVHVFDGEAGEEIVVVAMRAKN